MKKVICLLLVLSCFSFLCSCESANDKDKLIGTYYWNYKDRTDISDDTYLTTIELRKITFLPDNSFTYETSGTRETVILGMPPTYNNLAFKGSGTYIIKDGFINLEYKEDSGLDWKLPSNMCKPIPIPYHINEYTKQLILCVKNDGTSDWTKSN